MIKGAYEAPLKIYTKNYGNFVYFTSVQTTTIVV